MKTVAMVLGTIVLGTLAAPVFVWAGTRFIVGYAGYAGWVASLLSGVIR